MSSMGWRNPHRTGRRWLVFLLIAVLALAGLFGLLSHWARPSGDLTPSNEARTLRGTVIPIRPRASANAPLQGQIVNLPKPAHEQTPPPDARFLSRHDTRVERETKARDRGQHRAQERGVSPKKQPAPLTKPDHETRPSNEAAQEIVKSPRPETPEGTRAARVNHLAGADRILMPTVDGRSAMRNLQALGGGFVSDDALLDVEDEGDETLLNARSFKYFDYFQRIREGVRREWDPSTVYSGRDPYGKVYGKKDRLTILSVTLDARGGIERLAVHRESGLPFLDSEAIRAFRAAGPFPNPLQGLADASGRIAFRFGFLLEVGASGFKFFWQRPQ